MGFRANINGVEVKYKNRFVLEVVKQYINKYSNITYNKLKDVFDDALQGSIGVIKNEKDLTIWESSKEIDARKKRFFVDEPLYIDSEAIYVCTEWGTTKNANGNIDNFIEFAKNNLDISIEVINDDVSQINIKNIILYGAPGVGKTHNYQRLISMIENEDSKEDIFNKITDNKSNEKIELNEKEFQRIKDEKRVEFITFHQSYSYEDFIEGFRPNENGNIKLEDGIFKKLCEKADKNKKQNYYIVIDEINRGNISKIFGELITLIEEDKRDIYEVTLPYSKEPFKVPSNLYIIATMNSTDKSIATVDIALRRRFTFLKMKPNLDLVSYPNARGLMSELNIYITNNLGEDYQLGHSYFMKVQDDDDLEFVKEYKIKPLLEEYFYADGKSADEIMNEALGNGH